MFANADLPANRGVRLRMRLRAGSVEAAIALSTVIHGQVLQPRKESLMRLAIFSLTIVTGSLISNFCHATDPENKLGYAAQNPATHPANPAVARVRRIGPGSYNKHAAIA